MYRHFYYARHRAKDQGFDQSGGAIPKPFAQSGEANNSAIVYPVTVGYKVTAKSLIATRDIAYVMNCVRTGIVEGTDIRATIETIRRIPNVKMAQAMKVELPWFSGSLCERFRSNESVKLAHFAILDLDHVPDIETTKKDAIAKLSFVLHAFRSVRDGVKLIVQFDRPVTDQQQFRTLWPYIALLTERELRLPVDKTPDWSRACFFSYDPELLTNPHCQPLNVDMALKEAEIVLKISKSVIPGLTGNPVFKATDQTQSQDETSQGNGVKELDSRLRGNDKARSRENTDDDFSKARSIVLQLAQMQMPYSEWIRAGHAIYAGFGERGKELWDLFQSNPHYQDTEAELARHWRSFARVHTITLATLFYLGERYGCN